MTDQQFFNARDLWHTVEPDIVDGAERTMLFTGMYRARFDINAAASVSPVRTELFVPHALVRMKMRASATVVTP
jgi:hypothetical protein